MKKLLVLLLVLLPSFILAQTTQKVEFNNNYVYGDNVKFYKYLKNGTIGEFGYYSTNDSCLVRGASDSVYSNLYKFKDYNSIQFNVGNGNKVTAVGTIALEIIVQTVNAGGYYKSPWNIPDSLFDNVYWLSRTASNIDIVKLTSSVISAYDVSEPILIPPVGAEYFRIFVKSGATHTDTTDVELLLHQSEEGR